VDVRDERSRPEVAEEKERLRPAATELLRGLRGGGIPNAVAALEQLSYLLLLIFLDTDPVAKQWRSEFRGAVLRHPWTSLLTLHPDQRFQLYRERLFPALVQRPPLGNQSLAQTMTDAAISFPSTELFDLVVGRLQEVPKRPFACADLLDVCLDEVSATSQVGSPRTPPAVSEALIGLTHPREGDHVLDPAAGSADRLVMLERWRSGAPHGSIVAADADPTMVRLGNLSLLFHGMNNVVLLTNNTLTNPPGPGEHFDVILCQPPFGANVAPSLVDPELQIPHARTEVLFAELTLNRLAPGGRAALVLPANVAYGRGAAQRRLRERLVERGLRAVISLPRGTFQPHTNVETFVVAIGDPSDGVVFIDARDDERGQSDTSVRLLERSASIVDELLDVGLSAMSSDPELAERCFVVTEHALRANDCSLEPTAYRSRHEAAPVEESATALLREIERIEGEIMGHLTQLAPRIARHRSVDA
jgi:type I restriction enzyme M protein